MNHSCAYVFPRPMGFWAMVRLPKDGKARPIMEWCPVSRENKPKRFDDAYSALRAATDALEAYLNTNMRSEITPLHGAKLDAEKLFARAGA